MPDVQLIQKLRTETGAGMMECKKALDEAENDYEKALDVLRKKGASKAAKVADRATNEGVIRTHIQEGNNKGIIVQIQCETDFVAKNPDFINTVDDIAKNGLQENAKEYFEKIKDELILKIGENIQFINSEIIEGGYVSGYVHSNNKIASLISFSNSIDEELGKDIAMHIVAMKPQYVSSDEIPSDILDKEKEIYTAQLKAEGKPDEIIEKILLGKLNKFYDDMCLLNQSFIKDEDKKIKDLLGDIKITKFVLYAL